MHFGGPMGIRVLSLLFFLPLLGKSDEGAFQALPGQLKGREPLEAEGGPSPYLPESGATKGTSRGTSRGASPPQTKTIFFEDQEDSYEGKENPLQLSTLESSGVVDISAFDSSSSEDIIPVIHDQGRSHFSLIYFVDQYQYRDRKSIFERTYRKGKGSLNLGTLFFNMKRILWGPLFLGGGFGIGHNRGKAPFVNGEKSIIEFQLWAIPLELGIGWRQYVTRFLSFSVMGGPGVMGLSQSRNDKKSEDKLNRRFQLGTGFHGTASVGVALSSLFPRLGVSLYSSYRVSRMSLELFGRFQEYKRFLNEDIKISGATMGGGFTFEFL